ncbi:MAG: DUF4193 family protein [Actinobacteria bacterium]|nr:DUF4193 family protein [Actinomycetota bacterium]
MTDELDDIEEPDDIDEEALRSELGGVLDEDIEIDLDDEVLAEDVLADDDLDEDDLDSGALSDGDLDHDLDLPEIVPLSQDVLASDLGAVVKKDKATSRSRDIQPGLPEEEDDEEPSTDDVEEALDMILRNRLVTEDYGEDDDDDDDEADDGTVHVLPKQPGEFVCKSCFLVKNINQLADPARGLCKDCV